MTLEDKVNKLYAHEAIRQNEYRWARAADRCDEEMFRSCHHEDALIEFPFSNQQRDEFVQTTIEMVKTRYRNIFHHLGNILIDVDGDVAHVETYLSYTISTEPQPPLPQPQQLYSRSNHRYLSKYLNRNGKWLIAHRTSVSELSHEMISTGWGPGLGYGLNDKAPSMAGGDFDDPSIAYAEWKQFS